MSSALLLQPFRVSIEDLRHGRRRSLEGVGAARAACARPQWPRIGDVPAYLDRLASRGIHPLHMIDRSALSTGKMRLFIQLKYRGDVGATVHAGKWEVLQVPLVTRYLIPYQRTDYVPTRPELFPDASSGKAGPNRYLSRI